MNCSKFSSSCLTPQSLFFSLIKPQSFRSPFRTGRQNPGSMGLVAGTGGHYAPDINNNTNMQNIEKADLIEVIGDVKIRGNETVEPPLPSPPPRTPPTYSPKPYTPPRTSPPPTTTRRPPAYYLPPVTSRTTFPNVPKKDPQIAETTTDTSKTIQADNDRNHPPHIHSLDVECSKTTMTINIEFNRAFYGIIYSKGFYTNPECIYVKQNSGLTRYSFKVNLGSCGTKFINDFESATGQAYLENVLVLQNEPDIQEVWDTVRRVQCIWKGNINQTLTTNLSVDMLNQEIVTFNGDTATVKLDIQIGKGPFAPIANGLVKIGETMTLVVSVKGDSDFDLQVRDCLARDETSTNMLKLTDEKGCNLKPKLLESFKKTNDTGNTGASIIAYAFFHAFKFPDVMDLFIECNVELCKPNCEPCLEQVYFESPPSKLLTRNATANLEIKIGNDPFGIIANEPVRVNSTLTLVISVKIDPGFDIEVRDCFARDKDSNKSVNITDENGCILDSRFDAFQKTNKTRNTGASIIAFSSFKAFKFSGINVLVKCKVQICKTSCDPCPKANQQIHPGRRRRSLAYTSLNSLTNSVQLSDPIPVKQHLKVIPLDDLNTVFSQILDMEQTVSIGTKDARMSN
ncbi:uncharacterized protein LOC105196110 [Solenopsis invicta]|uniref:uncharacterized protein LOC105196110 n=1 Tax=Solenopsis invicta TaxID=13686 RepID=UPI00193DBDC3|nr:uncharacterized protein LOC105196110 [Solenopsis invicta]